MVVKDRYTLDDIANLVEVPQEVSPAAQASTNSYVAVTGSPLDVTWQKSVAYTIENTGADTIDWRVVAGNASDFSDAIIVQAEAAVAAAAFGNYSVVTAVWKHYRVEVKSTVADTPGEATVLGVGKG